MWKREDYNNYDPNSDSSDNNDNDKQCWYILVTLIRRLRIWKYSLETVL